MYVLSLCVVCRALLVYHLMIVVCCLLCVVCFCFRSLFIVRCTSFHVDRGSS